MLMAAIYDVATIQGEQEPMYTYATITTNASPQLDWLHDRMPVILAPDDWAKWLGEEPATPDELKALLAPFDGQLKIWPVNRQRIGNVRNKEREVAEPEAGLATVLEQM